MKNSEVVDYYNVHAKEKLASYYSVNRRLDIAWKSLNRYIPLQIGNILEIGCGVGDMSYKMSKKWKKANVTGLDLSDTAVKIATELFGSNRIKYFAGSFNAIELSTSFDLIVLFDVYEHVHASERKLFNEKLNNHLKPGGYLFMSIPSPRYQEYGIKNFPDKLQPVDEILTLDVFHDLSVICDAELLLYKNVNVYYEGDYTHIIFRKKDAVNRYAKTVTSSGPFVFRALVKTAEYLIYKNPIFSRRVLRLLKTKQKLKRLGS